MCTSIDSVLATPGSKAASWPCTDHRSGPQPVPWALLYECHTHKTLHKTLAPALGASALEIYNHHHMLSWWHCWCCQPQPHVTPHEARYGPTATHKNTLLEQLSNAHRLDQLAWSGVQHAAQQRVQQMTTPCSPNCMPSLWGSRCKCALVHSSTQIAAYNSQGVAHSCSSCACMWLVESNTAVQPPSCSTPTQLPNTTCNGTSGFMHSAHPANSHARHNTLYKNKLPAARAESSHERNNAAHFQHLCTAVIVAGHCHTPSHGLAQH